MLIWDLRERLMDRTEALEGCLVSGERPCVDDRPVHAEKR
jgi:hypothetical protein